jgi:hypothetical protein
MVNVAALHDFAAKQDAVDLFEKGVELADEAVVPRAILAPVPYLPFGPPAGPSYVATPPFSRTTAALSCVVFLLIELPRQLRLIHVALGPLAPGAIRAGAGGS